MKLGKYLLSISLAIIVSGCTLLGTNSFPSSSSGQTSGETSTSSSGSDGGSSSSGDDVAVENVSLNESSLVMDKGDTFQLVATVSPSTLVDKSVRWHSDAPEVATVNDNGLVTAVATGTAKVKAISNADTVRYAECSITVNPDLPSGEYAIYFDNNHNYDYTSTHYNNYYRFTAHTERSTDVEFYERNVAKNTATSDWRQVQATGELFNNSVIPGLVSITITYSDYDESDFYDPEVKIKYGWTPSVTPNMNYDGSYLTKYEDSLNSGVSFNFSNVLPSYFHLQFKYAKIQSIEIHYSEEEHIPLVDEVDHYELVKSLSEINTTSKYAFGSAKAGSGYMMSSTQFATPYNNDKRRNVEACTIANEQVEASSDILNVTIAVSGGKYYFQADNYQGDYEKGYLYTDLVNDNNLYIAESDSTGFNVTMNADYSLTIQTDTFTYQSKQYTKNLCFYSDSSNTTFCCYTKAGGKVNTYLYKLVEVEEYSLTLNSSNLSSMSSSYSNGNYGGFKTNGISFEYYRTTKYTSSGYAFKLIHPGYYYSDNGYPSSFYNVPSSPIYGIKKIIVAYSGTSGIKVSYSKNPGSENSTNLGGSSSLVTETVNVDKMNFFKIQSNGGDAYIKEITIKYSNQTVDITPNNTYSGNRKVVSTYSGSLVSGSSKISMYISPSETKEYTYYSKQYAYDNYSTIDKSKAFMIDPVDVCNYYLAFHEFPANYVTSSEKSSYGSKFGSYARQVSTYSRTDGYATAVPYNNQPGKSTPIYYELDIDLDGSYSLSSRQVGRVVVWQYGFSCYSDGSSIAPVCVYTDDHYATFQEYNCMGGFSSRFDSERKVTGKVHCPLTVA